MPASAHCLQRLAHFFRTLVLVDFGQYMFLFSRTRVALAAENLFLRKQLALFQERKVRPRRADDATRWMMATLSRMFQWRDALVNGKPGTFGVEMTISTSRAHCLDIGGRDFGPASAAMNMVGNFGGSVNANEFSPPDGLTGSSAALFRQAAFLNIMAILCWLAMRPRRIEENSRQVCGLSERG